MLSTLPSPGSLWCIYVVKTDAASRKLQYLQLIQFDHRRQDPPLAYFQSQHPHTTHFLIPPTPIPLSTFCFEAIKKISIATLALAMLAEVAIAKNCKGGLNYCGFTLLAIGKALP